VFTFEKVGPPAPHHWHSYPWTAFRISFHKRMPVSAEAFYILAFARSRFRFMFKLVDSFLIVIISEVL